MAQERTYHRIGMVARWRPVHLGQVPVLRGLCAASEYAFIGIGSANRFNARNPFTVEETTEMIKLMLNGWDNYTLVAVPDLDDGPRWRLMILDLFGQLDAFVTANPYVASLMEADYQIVHPITLVPEEERIPVSGTMVRREMALGGDWQSLVPPQVAAYITDNGLDERFRRKFGLETLALDSILDV